MITAVEEQVCRAHESGDPTAMTVAVIEGYGPEVFGFLVATHGDRGQADEVFSDFSVSLWQSMENFDLRCSARTWAYRVARATSVDHFRASQRRRESPLSVASQLSALVVRVRTETASHLKTERKTELQALRDTLAPEDRALLILRVDRQLPWKDLARVFAEELGDGSELRTLSEEELTRETARLRQRFQSLKRRLRELGRERGLLRD